MSPKINRYNIDFAKTFLSLLFSGSLCLVATVLDQVLHNIYSHGLFFTSVGLVLFVWVSYIIKQIRRITRLNTILSSTTKDTIDSVGILIESLGIIEVSPSPRNRQIRAKLIPILSELGPEGVAMLKEHQRHCLYAQVNSNVMRFAEIVIETVCRTNAVEAIPYLRNFIRKSTTSLEGTSILTSAVESLQYLEKQAELTQEADILLRSSNASTFSASDLLKSSTAEPSHVHCEQGKHPL